MGELTLSPNPLHQEIFSFEHHGGCCGPGLGPGPGGVIFFRLYLHFLFKPKDI